MTKSAIRTVVALLLFTGTALAQVTSDPFPQPIAATEGVISAKFVEFATVRDSGGNDDTDGDLHLRRARPCTADAAGTGGDERLTERIATMCLQRKRKLDISRCRCARASWQDYGEFLRELAAPQAAALLAVPARVARTS